MRSWEHHRRGVVTPNDTYYNPTFRSRHNIGPCVRHISSVKLVAHADPTIAHIAQVQHKAQIYRGYVSSLHESVENTHAHEIRQTYGLLRHPTD